MTGNIEANEAINSIVRRAARAIEDEHDVERKEVLETISREADNQASWL